MNHETIGKCRCGQLLTSDHVRVCPANDICANNHGGAETSVEAYQSTGPETRDSIRQKIYEFVQANGGVTCEEVEEALGLSHQSASARISELLKDNRIWIKPERGTTKTGRSCRIYGVTVEP